MSEQTFTCGELDIAIIGMSGKFPGADSIDELWHKLVTGQELTMPRQVNHPAGQQRIKLNSMIEAPYAFDAPFFNIPPGEALLLDPQHRVFLECCYHALEHAGYAPGNVNNISLYGSTYANSYYIERVLPYLHRSGNMRFLQAQIGNEKDYLCSYTAYKLGIDGAAVSVQSACSSSLMAVHLACESLLSYQCDMALAGGITLVFQPEEGYDPHSENLMSKDGHCAPFSSQASGTVYSSGVGLVVLKRLDKALADDDTIYAVIKGSATNNDGARRIGFAAPSAEGQTAVIRRALQAAAVKPDDINLIETHGTGTILGDEIELEALHRAYASVSAPHSIQIGSVKANIGHLGVASGILGLIKMVLTLYHGVIPAQINLNHKHNRLLQPTSPFFISNIVGQLPQGGKYLAGISSFGLGGANVHMIVQNWQDRWDQHPPDSQPHLFLFSAKTASALKQQLQRHALAFNAIGDEAIGRVAYTLRYRRNHYAYRSAFVADSLTSLRTMILARLADNAPFQAVSQNNQLIFVYPHQDSGLEQRLLTLLPMIPALAGLYQQMRLEVADHWHSGRGGRLIRQFVGQVVLSRWLMAQGYSPAYLLGYGVGEVTAGYLASTISLINAIQLLELAATAAKDSLWRVPDIAAWPTTATGSSPQLLHSGSVLADSGEEAWFLPVLATQVQQNNVLLLEMGQCGEFSQLFNDYKAVLGENTFFTLLSAQPASDSLAVFAALWPRGEDILPLSDNRCRRTIGLPGYPFDRINYEIPAANGSDEYRSVAYQSVSEFVEMTWRDMLCITDYDEQAVIFEFGATSMNIMSFVERCNQTYKLDLRITDIYARPCIAEQVNYISDAIDAALL